jgi:hypothetical protein
VLREYWPANNTDPWILPDTNTNEAPPPPPTTTTSPLPDREKGEEEAVMMQKRESGGEEEEGKGGGGCHRCYRQHTTLLYVHTGGIEGLESQLGRYRRLGLLSKEGEGLGGVDG